jgi:hypothetical protein
MIMLGAVLHASATSWPWLLAIIFAFLLGGEVEKGFAKLRRMKWAAAKRRPGSRKAPLSSVPKGKAFDPAEQLRAVESAYFSRRRLLNASETRLLGVIDRVVADLAPTWRVMAQVSLGEILGSEDTDAYRAINSKRVDLLIIDNDGWPRHAIEYQGSGHHLGPAATRDAVKKEALRKAGISYVEVMSGDTPNEVRDRLLKFFKSAALSG